MKDNSESLPTSYHLPVVHKDTTEAVLGTALDEGVGSYFKQAHDRLQVQNPELADAMGQFAMGMGVRSEAEIRLAFNIMLITHELLQKQAEIDALNQTIA